MIPVLTPDEMAAVDAAAPEPTDVLIDRAGAAVARTAMALMGGGAYGRRVHVIAGKGNNGGDGRRAAALLAAAGARVEVHDAANCPLELDRADLVIDAAYGTGFHGEWVAPDTDAAAVLAVDIPSGVDGMTGVVSGRALQADVTVTFAAMKPGHLFGDGRALSGRVDVVDIGLPLDRHGRSQRTGVVDEDDIASWWQPRPHEAHKWSSALRVVAGSPGMGGAAWLTAEAATRAGAGLVHLMSPGGHVNAPKEVITAPLTSEDWHRGALRDLDRFHALVIGPGLGRHERNVAPGVNTVSDAGVPVVVDGDALYALAVAHGTVAERIRRRRRATILTPHDGEFELLTGARPGDDRIEAARSLAAECRCVVLLKGPTTIVASSTGSVRLVANGDQRLATAGSGDVLSGIIGALVASGHNAFDAATCGAWIHAAAGNRGHPHGLVAGDLPSLVPGVLADVAAARRTTR